MPKKLFEPGNSGRPKGAKNKATRDIKALIQETVNFKELTLKLVEKAKEGEKWAYEMLYQYGFGKPADIQIVPTLIPQTTDGKPIQHEHTHRADPGTIDALADLARTFRRSKTGA
ncbi:MAG: hypothetical protein KGL39_42875 [Patescibacteria group bacterium]|nr:hypothetical protein [Patescibacteria group bacterium]